MPEFVAIDRLRARRAFLKARKRTAGGKAPDEVFTPLSLGVKLLRWYHPNDATQVTEAGGVISALGDKGTKSLALLGVGSPTISGGEVTFDGVDQGLINEDQGLDDESDSEYFIVMKSTGTFQCISGEDPGAKYFGLRLADISGEIQGGVHIGGATTNRQYADTDIGSDTFGAVGIRTTGSAYIININGTDYSGAGLTDQAGDDDGLWAHETAGTLTNFALGMMRRSTDNFYAGSIGKAGFFETGPLTTDERTDLVDWMKTESGI